MSAQQGCFVAVVGPSGAGKDTILSAARAKLAHDPRFVFARRVVTRPNDRHEDNDSISAADFAEAEARGAFLLAWHAHGQSYGLPASLSQPLADGCCVIANVSRLVVPDIRARFARSVIVEIRVDAAVLAMRLSARGREDEIEQKARLVRTQSLGGDLQPDVVIDNNHHIDEAIAAFMGVLVRLPVDSVTPP